MTVYSRLDSCELCWCDFIFQASSRSWKRFYHYTNYAGYQGIKRSGVIEQSDGNVLFGKGVYMTTLDPINYTKQEIAECCWGSGSCTFFGTVIP